MPVTRQDCSFARQPKARREEAQIRGLASSCGGGPKPHLAQIKELMRIKEGVVKKVVDGDTVIG
jgi:hypothetical protein